MAFNTAVVSKALVAEMAAQHKVIDGFRGRFEKNARDALSGCTNLFYAVAVVEVFGKFHAALADGEVELRKKFSLVESLSRMPISTSATAPDLLMQAGMKQAYQDLAFLLLGLS